MDGFAVYSNRMICRIEFMSEFSYGNTVHSDPPGANQLLCSAARCNACIAEDFLQSLFHDAS
ncbi:hypothetical protein HMPREF9432_00849 [Selenomonas noxia F0398]|uniref:Uncharacterized protein n=1 Tax=Selenomonas noxia F0398 TaxID=702437 RepID=A0ABN0DRJ8_9FIRM|nr:hypothetical protein HMPREF9432_00849 [Selenomonas noxia F0398]